jgi:RNA polymerase sigma factor (sigma-70 family)
MAWMQVNITAARDPVTQLRRNSFMDTAIHAFPNADAHQSANGYVVAGQVLRRHKEGSLNADDQIKRMEWSAQLQAIRDQQDQAAFAALFRHFAPRVKAFLMRSGMTASFAEECTQEVMATVWRKAHMFDGTKASVSTWIYTIARNRKIDMIRKTRRPEPAELPWGPDADPDAAEMMMLAQDTAELGRALASLPEKQRGLIERAYFGELTHSEIAAETGLPLGTIKSRIRLALDRLRHAMT